MVRCEANKDCDK